MREAIKDLYTDVKTQNSDLPKVAIWIIFAGKLFVYGIGFLFMLIILAGLRNAVNSANRETRKYPSSRYRKVVKEGLFWDSTEYQER